MACEAMNTESRAAQPTRFSSTLNASMAVSSAAQPASVHAEEVSADRAEQLTVQDMSTHHVTLPHHEPLFEKFDELSEWLQDLPQ